jgi:hypothetical protein
MSAGKRDIEHEFDVLMAKAGAEVPADWRAGALAGYREILASTDLLRQKRTAASEPANIYSLAVILRSK